MDAQLNGALDQFLALIGIFFQHRWAAPFVLSPIMLAVALGLWARAELRARPYLHALTSRITVLTAALGNDDSPEAERVSFAKNFGRIEQTMETSQARSPSLVQAWLEFEENIIDPTNDIVIQSTTRPNAFFARAIPRPKELALWSNTFVGIGLLLTFLGIVVALNATAQGLDAGASVQKTQTALHLLLTITSVKFFTSIAVVFCSILLRYAGEHLQSKIDKKLALFCELLERGMLYVPPQTIAAKQLEEMKRQSAQLEKFNTDLALQIGEQFNTAITPLAASLGQLNDNIGGMSERLGEGVGRAVEGAASGELRALGRTLHALGEQLQGLSGSVQGSGEEAAKQIRAAAEDFARSAEGIRTAFDVLTDRVANVGSEINIESEAITIRQREALEKALSSFETVNQVSSEQIQANIEVFSRAATTTAEQIHQSVMGAMTAAASDSRIAVRRSLEEAGATFATAGDELKSAIIAATTQIVAIVEAIGRAERGTAANADHLVRTAEGLRTTSGALTEAADGFAKAARPVAEASVSFRDSAARIGVAVERSERAAQTSFEEMGKLAEEIRATQSEATDAWSDYRERFSQVDAALEKTIIKMVEALDSAFSSFRQFASEFDAEMGKAIGRLHPVVDAIAENSEEIAELSKAMRESDTAHAQ